jgi:Leucine-rich repeat (LRR) protein
MDSGVEWSDDCACEKIVNIPDANFKKELVANYAINTNKDNEIQVCEAENYTGEIDVNEKKIADLTGIESFINLTYLKCSGNEFEEVNLTQNINRGK